MRTHLLTDRIEVFSRALVGITCGFVLLAPAAILMLCDLDPGRSLAVVGVFGAFVAVVLACLEMKAERFLLAMCAYVAVTMAFLSNQ